jgi:hypothetical protein
LKQVAPRYGDRLHGHVLAFARLMAARPI